MLVIDYAIVSDEKVAGRLTLLIYASQNKASQMVAVSTAYIWDFPGGSHGALLVFLQFECSYGEF